MLPDVHTMFGKMIRRTRRGRQARPRGRAEIARAIERLPLGRIDDLKPGGAVIVTSTRGTNGSDGDWFLRLVASYPLFPILSERTLR